MQQTEKDMENAGDPSDEPAQISSGASNPAQTVNPDEIKLEAKIAEDQDILGEEYLDQLIALGESSKQPPSMEERTEAVAKLQQLLDSEKKGPLVKEKFRLVQEQVHDPTEYTSALGVLLRQIRPFNIKFFKELIIEYQVESKRVANQEIYLLLGPSGAGKSTTLHYLAGSKMVKVVEQTAHGEKDHITFSELSKDCTDPKALKSVEMSALCISCTKFIKSVRFKTEDDDEFNICDCPGLEDTRGPELDVSNIYGVVIAAQQCAAIIPVILLSKNGMADRMIGLKRISQDLANFFKNIKQDIGAFKFLFTKYLNRTDPNEPLDKDHVDKVKEELKVSLNGARAALNDDDKTDKNLVIFFDKLCETVEDPDDVLMIDPFDEEERPNILDALADNNAIKNPQNSFGMRISEKSRSALNDQLQMNLMTIQEAGLKQQRFRVIGPKLLEIKFLSETLKSVDFIDDAYHRIRTMIEDNLKEKFSQSKEDLQSYKESRNQITVQQMERAYSNYTAIRKVTEALVADGKSTEVTIPQQFLMFIVNSMRDFKKEFESADEQLLSQPEPKQLLTSMSLISKYFEGESVDLKDMFLAAKNHCTTKFDSTLESASDSMKQYQFESFAASAHRAQCIARNLEGFGINFNIVELESLQDGLLGSLRKEYNEVNENELKPLIECSDRERQKESLKKVIKTYTKIEEISNSNTIRILYGDDAAFKAVLEEMKKSINECFENVMSQIKETVYDKSTELKEMQGLLPMCQLAEKINQEIQMALYPQNGYLFADMVNKVSAWIMESVRKIDTDIRNSGNLEVKWDHEDADKLRIRTNSLEKLKWFDEFQKQGTVENFVTEIYDNLTRHFESIQEQTQSYFDNHEFKSFAKGMGRLSIFLHPEYQKLYEAENELYMKKLKEVLAKGKLLLQDDKDLKFMQLESHLVFIEGFNNVELEQQIKVYNLMRQEIKQHLSAIKHFIISHADKNYHFKGLDAHSIKREDADNLGRKFTLVRQMKANYPNIGLIFNVDQIQEDMLDSLNTLICNMDERRRLAQKRGNTPDLNAMDEQLKFLTNLDKFLPAASTNTFKSIFTELDNNLFENQKCTVEEILEAVRERNFMEASYQLHKMDKGAQLIQAKNYVQRALMNYAKEIESKAIQIMHRSQPSEYYDLDRGIRGMQEAIRKFEVKEEDMKEAEEEGKSLNQDIIKNVKVIEELCEKRINDNVKKRLDEIDGSIESTDFKEAAQYLDLVEDIVQKSICEENLNKQNHEKYIDLKANFKKKIDKIIEEYGKRNVKDYQRYPLKQLVERLKEARLPKYINQVQDQVRNACIGLIENLSAQEANLEGGLRNKEYLQLKAGLRSLPDEMKEDLSENLSKLETDYEIALDNEKMTLEQNIKDFYLEDVKRKYDQLQSQKIKRREIIVYIQDTLRDQITPIFENVKQLVRERNAKKLFKEVSQISFFSEIDIPAVKDVCQQTRTLIENMLKSAENLLKSQLKDGNFDSDKQTADNVVNEIDFIYCLKNSIIENSKVKSFIDFTYEGSEIENNVTSFFQNKNKKNNNLINEPMTVCKISTLAKFLTMEQLQMKVCSKLCLLSGKDEEEIVGYKKLNQETTNQVNNVTSKLEKPFGDIKLKFTKEIKEHYENIYESYSVIKKVEDLKDHVNGIQFAGAEVSSGQIKSKVDTRLIESVKEVIDQSLDRIRKKEFGNEETELINTGAKHLDVLIAQFKTESAMITECTGSQEQLNQSVDSLIEEYDTKIKEGIVINDQAKTLDNTATQIIELKELSEKLQPFSQTIDKKIDEQIKKNTAKEGETSVTHLIEVLKKKAQEGGTGASRLLDSHEVFKGHKIADMNNKLHNSKFKDVLPKVKAAQFDNDCKKKDVRAIETHEAHFEEELQKAYQNFQDIYGIYDKNLNKYTGLLGKFLSPDPQYDQIVSELNLCMFKKAYKWNDKDKLTTIPKIMSYIFLLITLTKAQSIFEGKSKEKEGKAALESQFLITPHAAQVISILRILGIGNKDTKDSESLHNHLVEILTGQGKSITCGVTLSLLALLGYDCYCACYSKNLSMRDYKEFQRIFELLNIQKYIFYGTMEELCEKLINRRGNIRECVAQTIVSNVNPQGQDMSKLRPSVLFIDEVDVFFEKQFFGAVYQPNSLLREPEFRSMLECIWNKQKDGQKVKYVDIKNSEEFKECTEKYKDWIDLVTEQGKSMIEDVIDMENHRDYKISDDKIGYLYRDQYIFNMTKRYMTQYAYLRESQENKITKEAFENNSGMLISCGNFSYAQIPKEFNVIMGVTGTLQTVSDVQRKIIVEDFKIHHETYMPSVFGEKQLKFNPEKDVHVVKQSELYQTIADQIHEQLIGSLKGKRAVIVIWEDEKALKDAYHDAIFDPFRHNMDFITEAASVEEVNNAVNKASTQGRITFLTRNYGRGTDFIVLDQIVLGNGGLCTIETFLPESESELIQIQGRSARQGQKGSYVMVVAEEELEKIGMKAEQVDQFRNQDALFDEILKSVKKKFDDIQGGNKSQVKELEPEHQKAMQFLKDLFNYEQKKSDVNKFLLEANKGPPTAGKFKTLLMVDATASMYSLLEKVKHKMKEMFDRIGKILQEHGYEAEQSLMKISFYRNYNCDQERIFGQSEWEFQALNLIKYLGEFDADYGWGNEAIEIGLCRAIDDIKEEEGLSQIIIIGDAGCNTPQEMEYKQQRDGRDAEYWKKHFPNLAPSREIINQHFKLKEIPIHTMWLEQRAKADFAEFSSLTGGTCNELDVNKETAGELLTKIISCNVLEKIGGSDLVASYNKAFGFT